MSLYNAAGQRQVTIVSGSTYTGLYAVDGTFNGVLDVTPTVIKGSQHPCGALNVQVTTNTVASYAPDGARYIKTSGSGYALNGGPVAIPDFALGVTRANTATFRSVVQAGSRNAKVACIGDSLIRGQSTGGGTSQFINGWVPKTASRLSTLGTPSGANNFFGSGACWGQSFSMANIETGDARITHTGAGWSPGGALTAGGTFMQATATGTFTFTPQSNITNIDFYWRDNSTGRSFTYQIDAGATTQVDSTNVDQVTKVSITGLSLASHSITFAWVVGTPVILGIDAYDASRKEISLWNWGACGFNSNQMTNLTSTAAAQLNMMTTLAPDLCIIEGGIYNDLQQGISVPTSKANITTLVQKALTTGNALLYIPPWLSTYPQSAHQPYIDMMYQVSSEQGVGVIDITRKVNWTSYAAESAASFVSDFVHPTATGYVDQSLTYADIIKFIIT